jgi:error-prone DNA polymerase
VRLGLRLAKGLANAHGALIPLARAERPFASLEDLWRRAGIPVAVLEHLANADAFGSLGLSRRDALWAIRGLSPAPLPLFAAADERDAVLRPEVVEPPVSLTPMTEGREVVEDYRSKGLTLRAHPVAFLRDELRQRRMIACASLKTARDGQRVTLAGLVLVRQRPGSASGVLFMTVEDETDFANLVVWPALFERQRRLVLSAGMIAARGRVQREGEVIHLVAEHLIDLSDLLHSVSERTDAFPLPSGRSSKATAHGREPVQRTVRSPTSPPGRNRNGIKIPTRDFR